jgi:hypothetical protein
MTTTATTPTGTASVFDQFSHHVVDQPPRVITYGTRGQIIGTTNWPTVRDARSFARHTSEFIGGVVVDDVPAGAA